jgi:ribonuclease T1
MTARRPPGGVERLVFALIAGLLLVVALAGCAVPAAPGGPSPAASPRSPASQPATDPLSGLATIAVASLPPEARRTLSLIEAGGPLPYAQDGVVFQNREGVLPSHVSGYYHEYTVVTPGSADRGARRIVVGGAGERYYTADHYASFERIWP